MKVYRIYLSKNTLPIYFLPIKFMDQGKIQCGFLLYELNKKGVTKDYLLHRYHGILALPEVDKNQNDVDASVINTADEFIDLFLNNFDVAGLNAGIRESAMELDFELTDENKREIIEYLDVDEDGKFDHTVFLE